MNKEEIRDELKRHEAACAELRAKLEEPEQPEPKAGEVWQHEDGDLYYIASCSGHGPCKKLVAQNLEWTTRWMPASLDPFDGDIEQFTRLGTFDEVFVRRDPLKEVIEEVLADEDAWAGGLIAYSQVASEARDKLRSLL